MESHLVSARLHDSRERMRALLLPDPVTGRMGAFPRSAVMQFIFNPRARQLALSIFSLFLMLRRLRRAPALSFWPQLTRSLGGLLSLTRN